MGRSAESRRCYNLPVVEMPHRLTLLVLVLVVSASQPAQAGPAEPEIVPGDLIVHWRSRRARAARLQIGPTLFAKKQRALTDRASLFRLGTRSHRATRDAIAALARDPRVAHVEPNTIRRPFLKPNDPHYLLQWNLTAVRMEQAWDDTTGSPGVVVAVIDTGIKTGHPDLAGRVVQGYDFISDPASAGDGDGRDADPADEGNESLLSSAFHGTHVVGVIGAASNNEKGIVGVDWACKVQPVRALGIEGGKGRDSDIAAAIRWAAGVAVSGAPANPTPAKVINLSFGGPGASQLLSDAIRDAQSRGAIVVAAAGNQGGDVQNIYPAVIPDVVTVGAIQLDGKRAPYSNYGEEVDVMAPGGNMQQKLPLTYQGKEWSAGILGTLFSTSSGKYTYHLFEGTSQATPLVAGVVALMLTINPSLDSRETVSLLKKTANPANMCSEGCGSGLVDAAAALAATRGNPNPHALGEKLPLSYRCTTPDECRSGICRQAGGYQVCTQPCTAQPCPVGTNCEAGYCAPTGEPPFYSAGNPSAGQMGPGETVWGSGCECDLAPRKTAPASLILILTLVGLALLPRKL